jgi:hypothetical protein
MKNLNELINQAKKLTGKQILLDEPFELEPNTWLIFTILSNQIVSDEHEAWLHLSRRGLENAYVENEVEYTVDMIKKADDSIEVIIFCWFWVVNNHKRSFVLLQKTI